MTTTEATTRPTFDPTPGAPTLKRPALASQGMVTSNHPLASLAGNELLLQGGNAVDAAIGTMFALSVVEPMMVTIFGAGFVNIRLADGTSTVIDNYVVTPSAARADMFEPIPGGLNHEVEGDLNRHGHLSVAVGGTLKGWSLAVEQYGRLPLAEVVAPAVRLARQGFRVSPYLRRCIEQVEDQLARFRDSAKVFLPGGAPPEVGSRIARPEYADTLEAVGRHGPGFLYGGPLGQAIADYMAAHGGLITTDDIEAYRAIEREPVRGTYRGLEIVGPPPPSSGPTHAIEILNFLEGFDVRSLGYGTPDGVHLLSEAMKIAFADRTKYMADPMTVEVPIGWLTSKEYAEQRRREFDATGAQRYEATIPPDGESQNTTTCTAIDAEGNIVATTNTLHELFGSKVTVPGTGMLLNDCMQLMDPVPGRTNSIAPGKRVLSSMTPVILLQDGRPRMALGAVGGLRIFSAVTQAIVNVVDHGMPLQQAFEAPRMFDRGIVLELEQGFPNYAALAATLRERGHDVDTSMTRVAGGINGFLVHNDGMIEGAACWRADGAPVGYSGGDAWVDEQPALRVT